MERKIKLTKWVQFKNEGYNNVFNKDASRQNTKIIFSFLGFLACIIVFIISIFYTLGEHTHAIKREIYTQIVMSVIFGMTFLISAIKLIHYKLTDVWVKRDAVIINLDTNCSNNKNVSTVDYVIGKMPLDEHLKLMETIKLMPDIFNDYMNLTFDNLMNKYN